MAAPTPSKLDFQQVLQGSFDEATGSLRVDATVNIGSITVDLSHTTDSVRLGDGTVFLTSTTVGPKTGLDVNVLNSLGIIIDSTDDNILVLGTEDGTKTGTQHVFKIPSDLKLRVKDEDANTTLSTINSKLIDFNTTAIKSIQLFTMPFDAITATYPSATQEVYKSRLGGIAGTVQQTATVNYTDSTKNFLLNVAVV